MGCPPLQRLKVNLSCVLQELDLDLVGDSNCCQWRVKFSTYLEDISVMREEAQRKWRQAFVELTPREFMLKIINKRGIARRRRNRIARVALPFFHRKLGKVKVREPGPFPQVRDGMTSEEVNKVYRDMLQWFRDKAAWDEAFKGSIDPAEVIKRVDAADVRDAMRRRRARRRWRKDRILSLIEAKDQSDEASELDHIKRAARVSRTKRIR